MKIDFLYRGVSLKTHSEGTGLKPKETSIKRELEHGQKYATHGNGIVHGTSKTNGVIGHQFDSSLFPTSGISTSLDLDIAKKYATRNKTTKGKVYKIDCSRLDNNNIEMIIVSELMKKPRFPEDKEIILRERNDKILPMDIVVEILDV